MPGAAGATAAPAASAGLYRSPLSSRPLVRTLVALLQAMVGHVVRVELRNESALRGRLEEVDAQGNLRLAAATYMRPSGGGRAPGAAAAVSAAAPPPPLDSVFVAGRSVRYVHIPDRVDGAALLTAHESQLDRRLLESRRRKRAGRMGTWEDQQRAVDKKEAALAKEMAEQQQQQQSHQYQPQNQQQQQQFQQQFAPRGSGEGAPDSKRPRT
jgi:small nuclear ribonucleoprotein (snRNP)-like protein